VAFLEVVAPRHDVGRAPVPTIPDLAKLFHVISKFRTWFNTSFDKVVQALFSCTVLF
jgi:hypothetical protein